MTERPDDCDVLVVGGGIHGVGVAQAAAAAGFKVVVLEQQSLAYGTSSRSSKLIHGGLRYLESFQVRLVWESLRERELLIQLAPDLVRRQDFYLPVYDTTKRAAWMMRAGLSMYALLAGMSKSVRFQSVSPDQWDSLDGITTDGLRKVFRYSDGQTDDRLLTQAVMRSAESLGANLICPATLTSIQINESNCDVGFRQDDQLRTIRAHTVVNAAGPWANEVLAAVTPRQPGFPVDNVQGTHLELPGTLNKGCYYIEMPQDGRAVFVMPWKGHTLLGTTEHVFHGEPADVKPLEIEIDYLLEGYRRYFPQRSDEVLDAWAGLRVLPAATGAAFRRSRETSLPVDNRRTPRLISIFGGKLTGYRATALRVMKKLKPSLPHVQQKAKTSELPLLRE